MTTTDIIRDRAVLDADGGNVDRTPLGWVHYYNHETLEEIRREHAAGRRFLNVYDESVPLGAELRFADLLDENGWALHVVEDNFPNWRWTASGADGAEIPQGEWHQLLLQARAETPRG